jgi:hypothetical protein
MLHQAEGDVLDLNQHSSLFWVSTDDDKRENSFKTLLGAANAIKLFFFVTDAKAG